jgi:hypothetical protein
VRHAHDDVLTGHMAVGIIDRFEVANVHHGEQNWVSGSAGVIQQAGEIVPVRQLFEITISICATCVRGNNLAGIVSSR